MQALAALESLNAELLSHDSATLTLDRWCEAHGFAKGPASVTVEPLKGEDKPVTAEQRRILGVDAHEPIRYRRVRLSCGARVLSEADNWYVPARLTPEMNQTLDTTDISFGRAVQALKFRRHTLSAALLWRPLPEDWQSVAPPPYRGLLIPPADVLEHKAVLALPDGTPFSEVVETYKSDVLAFPQPPAPTAP